MSETPRRRTRKIHPAWPSMKAEFKKHTPESFQTDFTVHDHNMLNADNDPPKRFGWTINRCGTHLHDTRAKRKYISEICSFYRTSSDRAHRYYIYDGAKLKNVNRDRFTDWLREMNKADEEK